MNKLYVVGIGPGHPDQMTVRAANVLETCQVIIGYTLYLELLKPVYPNKIYRSTAMRQEIERCRMAYREALKGYQTALVCSGDSGIYGMASLLWELHEEYPEVELEVIPGVTAALGGASILGAPLGHDCCLISLSDLLTPWEVIEQRLQAAAHADFVICLYNPASKKRSQYLRLACDCLLRIKSGDTVCGLVKNIARKGETWQLFTLAQLREQPADMFCTVYIGNQKTRIIEGRMVTPRGYHYGHS